MESPYITNQKMAKRAAASDISETDSKKQKVSDTTQIWIISVRWGLKEWTKEDAMSNREEFERIIKEYSSRWIYQLEEAEGGLWHFQCYARLKAKDRPKTLAVKWNEDLRGVEVSCCSSAGKEALAKYAMKKDSTYREGPWVSEDVYVGDDLPTVLLPWQENLRKYLLGPVNPREIIWIVDEHGNSGKSIFAKYMFHHHNVLKLSWGDTGDLINLVCKLDVKRAYIFDLSRTKPKTFSSQDLYSAMEDIKNGYLVNTKYETAVKAFAPPHIVVFANTAPVQECLSADRWNVIYLPKEANPLRETVKYNTFSLGSLANASSPAGLSGATAGTPTESPL